MRQSKPIVMEGEKTIDSITRRVKDDGFLFHAKRFAGSHHEKWEGTGYPRGLAGDDIPLEGRIMIIADVYDALVSERPYKKAYSHEEAVEIIKKDSGTYFDPQIIKAFLEISEDFWVESVSTDEH
jgi:putative two-component system response regulator